MLFLSTYVNKIDKKGRVSVPATFRAALARQEFQGIIAYISLLNPCIEGCGMERIEKLKNQLEQLDPYSEERDAFAATIFGGSVQLPFDGEGRVMLPEWLIEKVKIGEQAMFVGKGDTFEIWSPAAFDSYAAKAREIAWEKRLKLRADGGKQ